MKKKTNTVESRDEKKQNQCNERHLHLFPPSSTRKMSHDQASFLNYNRMKLCNRKFPGVDQVKIIFCDDFRADSAPVAQLVEC